MQWHQWLPEFRFAISTALQESTGYTPAAIAMGHKLKGPLEKMLHRNISPDHPAYATVEHQEALFQGIRSNVAHAEQRQGKYYNSRCWAITYNVGDHMWVHAFPPSRVEDLHMAKLAPKWKGSAYVLHILI